MKSPFRKVRGLRLHKHDKRHRQQRSIAQLDELSQASQVFIFTFYYQFSVYLFIHFRL